MRDGEEEGQGEEEQKGPQIEDHNAPVSLRRSHAIWKKFPGILGNIKEIVQQPATNLGPTLIGLFLYGYASLIGFWFEQELVHLFDNEFNLYHYLTFTDFPFLAVKNTISFLVFIFVPPFLCILIAGFVILVSVILDVLHLVVSLIYEYFKYVAGLKWHGVEYANYRDEISDDIDDSSKLAYYVVFLYAIILSIIKNIFILIFREFIPWLLHKVKSHLAWIGAFIFGIWKIAITILLIIFNPIRRIILVVLFLIVLASPALIVLSPTLLGYIPDVGFLPAGNEMQVQWKKFLKRSYRFNEGQVHTARPPKCFQKVQHISSTEKYAIFSLSDTSENGAGKLLAVPMSNLASFQVGELGTCKEESTPDDLGSNLKKIREAVKATTGVVTAEKAEVEKAVKANTQVVIDEKEEVAAAVKANTGVVTAEKTEVEKAVKANTGVVTAEKTEVEKAVKANTGVVTAEKTEVEKAVKANTGVVTAEKTEVEKAVKANTGVVTAEKTEVEKAVKANTGVVTAEKTEVEKAVKANTGVVTAEKTEVEKAVKANTGVVTAEKTEVEKAVKANTQVVIDEKEEVAAAVKANTGVVTAEKTEVEKAVKANTGVVTAEKTEVEKAVKANTGVVTAEKAEVEKAVKANTGVVTAEKAEVEKAVKANTGVVTAEKTEVEKAVKANTGVVTAEKAEVEKAVEANTGVVTAEKAEVEKAVEDTKKMIRLVGRLPGFTVNNFVSVGKTGGEIRYLFAGFPTREFDLDDDQRHWLNNFYSAVKSCKNDSEPSIRLVGFASSEPYNDDKVMKHENLCVPFDRKSPNVKNCYLAHQRVGRVAAFFRYLETTGAFRQQNRTFKKEEYGGVVQEMMTKMNEHCGTGNKGELDFGLSHIKIKPWCEFREMEDNRILNIDLPKNKVDGQPHFLNRSVHIIFEKLGKCAEAGF